MCKSTCSPGLAIIRGTCAIISGACAIMPGHSAELPPTPIYQAVATGMEHRLAFMEPKLRSTNQLQAGVLDAPLGNVAIVFANLVRGGWV